MSLNPRKLSVDIIYSVTKKHSNLSDELDNVRRQYLTLSELDIRFITEITNGVLRNLEYIDCAISLASDIKLNKISPYVLCVLRTGVYQILFMDKVPESAAVNECVKIIKKSSNLLAAFLCNSIGIGYIVSAMLAAIAAMVSLSPPIEIALEITSTKLVPSRKATTA